jgi:hypothetical protein
MYTTSSDFPSELADIGLAAAADPRFAECLIAALALGEPARAASGTSADTLDTQQVATA